MFCIYLRTNSDLCHLQHKLIGFYNRDEKCLQRGTNWVFKLSGLCFVFKGLNVQVTENGLTQTVYRQTDKIWNVGMWPKGNCSGNDSIHNNTNQNIQYNAVYCCHLVAANVVEIFIWFQRKWTTEGLKYYLGQPMTTQWYICTETVPTIYTVFGLSDQYHFIVSRRYSSGCGLCGRLQLKRDGTRWRTGGEVKGKLANGVGSQYPSHYLGTWCIQTEAALGVRGA